VLDRRESVNGIYAGFLRVTRPSVHATARAPRVTPEYINTVAQIKFKRWTMAAADPFRLSGGAVE
jgi:hypothetical protein